MTGPGACDRCLRRSWLVAHLAAYLERLRADRGRIREVLALPDERLIGALAGRHGDAVADEWRALDVAALRRSWRAAGVTSICRHEPEYPSGLHDLGDPPAVLHVAGDAARLARLLASDGRPAVAVVGARRATADGRATARALGRGLSAAGVTVVSGMAMGIDAAVHEGALEGGAATVAVLACGPEHAYPASRAPLHAELVGRALVVAELPPGTAPFRWAFPARNRIIAALAEMTIVIEAAERSGSLITAEIAMDLGREVGATPGAPSAWHSAGANALLRDGARFVRDATDVLDDVLGAGEADVARAAEFAAAGLSPEQRRILEDLDRGCDTPGALAAARRDVGTVLAALTELELLGHVVRHPGGRYARSGR